MNKLSYEHPHTWIATVLSALEECDFTDEKQDDVNTAMAWIMEELEEMNHEID